MNRLAAVKKLMPTYAHRVPKGEHFSTTVVKGIYLIRGKSRWLRLAGLFCVRKFFECPMLGQITMKLP